MAKALAKKVEINIAHPGDGGVYLEFVCVEGDPRCEWEMVKRFTKPERGEVLYTYVPGVSFVAEDVPVGTVVRITPSLFRELETCPF